MSDFYPYASSMTNARAEELVSTELSEKIDMDPAYRQNMRGCSCRGKRLLRQMPSLQSAWILHEIFCRPDER